MRVVAWLSLVSTGAVLAACGGYTNLGNGPDGGGGEDDGSAGASMQSGGRAGKGSVGSGGTGTAGTAPMGAGGSMPSGTGGSGSTPMTPCEGRPCGSTCAYGAPAIPEMSAQGGGDGEGDTVVALGYCASDGSCGLAFPMCPGTPCNTGTDCPLLPAICGVCADGSVSCPTNACVDGMCVVDAPGCANECETALDCTEPLAPCQACPNGVSACPVNDCVMGRCVASVPGCGGYEPCAGASCGDRCSPCAPDDLDCPDPQVLSFCDAAGRCGTSTPSCGTGNLCMSTLDCPQLELCYMCGDGSCASFECVDGSCRHVCPDVPTGPSCMTVADCGTPPPVCEDCGDGSCAQMACVNGACEMVCNAVKMCDADGACPSCGQCGNLDVCVPYECVEGLCTLDCASFGNAD